MTVRRDVTLRNWMEPPYNRTGFQIVRELTPTALIRNRTNQVRPLPVRPRSLESLAVSRADGARATLAQHLESSYCDAICVVHDGAIVFERYLNGMAETTPHLIMSVSKSVTAAALGASIGRGLVAADDLVCDVAPEFAGTSLDGATVQHVIDMTTGTGFVEDYGLYDDLVDDPSHESPLIEYERQAGYRPLDGRAPIGVLAHFRQYPMAFDHGERFDYRSPLTNIAARVLEVVNGARFADIISRDLWGPLGQEHDADVMVDPVGQAIAEGGISCTLRDLARFGLMYLADGVVGDVQVVPAAWVTDTRDGTADAIARYAAGGSAGLGVDFYRNGFWVLDRGDEFSGFGIFGQYCYVHRPTRTVIARMSTFPSADPADLYDENIGAFRAICEALS